MSQKRILVAPLDWGLGHASRCIPIIHELQKQDAVVIIAASNKPLNLLRQEFPDIEYVVLPGMNIAYPKQIPFSLFMAYKAPLFLKWVKQEGALIDSIVKSHKIDGVISDNRYGLHQTDVPTVLITHQLFIKASIFSLSVKNLTKSYANRFDFCWIPDFEGEPNLSGELSHGETTLSNLRYIGPLSRFKDQVYYKANIKYDVVFILSGPEPSRTLLEQSIVKQLKKIKVKALLVRGLVDAESNKFESSEGIDRVNYLNSEELQRSIMASELVVCRSGYSSIMDLAVLKKKVLFVPTKGQTEQEYLAKRLKRNGMAMYSSRAKLNLKKQMKQALSYSGLTTGTNPALLESSVQEFLNLVSPQ